MRYLLDVNLLIALGHSDHALHERALAWYLKLSPKRDELLTCSITELGFVRVCVQAGLQNDVAHAIKALVALKRSSSIPLSLLPDGIGADRMPAFVAKPQSITDGHLIELAHESGTKLATLDKGIPGAFVLP